MITLGVKSIKKSREFYEGVLEFPVKFASEDFVAYELNNLVLGLFPINQLAKDIGIENINPGFTGTTIAHNVPTNDDVITILEKVRNSNYPIVKEAQKVEWGNFIGGYFTDPDGHLWEITSNPSAIYNEHFPSDSTVIKR